MPLATVNRSKANCPEMSKADLIHKSSYCSIWQCLQRTRFWRMYHAMINNHRTSTRDRPMQVPYDRNGEVDKGI
ncbi:hypothetical protein L1987_06268 [Smallanthus sonchifolius]|uniref:Uncharacterized protein n=1 Tax=Smallanthus sonchifolius TaxID=185202 RepID=A0ACB9JXQ9_9ASTR|nr:hypothetical protein L1987_06268 [Smallanthus sonchifolius]